MKKVAKFDVFIEKCIKFRICYKLALWGFILSIVLSLAIYVLPIFPPFNQQGTSLSLMLQGGFMVIGQLAISILGLYVFLGFGRYFQVIHENKFKNIIFVIFMLYIIKFLISFDKGWTILTMYIQKLNAIEIISYFLLFYIFSKIKNEDKKYFYQLATFNFILCILHISFAFQDFDIIRKVLMSLFFISWLISMSILYIEIKLFKQLYIKYEQPDLQKI
jgi:hypothetical protein